MLEELETEAITRRVREIQEEETLSDDELESRQRRRATKDRNRTFKSSFREKAYIYEMPEDRKRRREIEKVFPRDRLSFAMTGVIRSGFLTPKEKKAKSH